MTTFVMVKDDLLADKNINSNEFRVYTYLMRMYNDEKKYAFPSIKTISENSNLSESSVKRAVKKLEKIGYLTIEKKQGVAGNFNVYKNFKHLVTRAEAELKAENEKNRSKEEIKVEVKEEAKSKIINHSAERLEQTEASREVIPPQNSEAAADKTLTKTEIKQKEIDNNSNVRMARAVTDIDKSNFAKTVLSIADETLVREAIRNFKNKKGKNATFLITILVDEYFKNSIQFPTKMFNLLKKGLKNPFLEQPHPVTQC